MNAAPWYAPPVARPGHCIVIGGGLAGCSVAHALDQLGLPVTLVEQQVVGSGASGNQRAVLRPHLNRTSGIHNRFSQTAFLAAVSVLQQLANTGCKPEYELCGVLQLLDNIDNWPAFDCAVPLDASAMQKFSHGLFPCNINREPGTRKGALHSESAGWVNIASYCQALLSNASNLQIYEHHAAEQITPTAQRWQVAVNHRGIRSTLEADNVIVTSGPGTQPLLAGHDLPLTISAGQTTRYSSPVFTGGTIITGSRYLIPEDGICTLGATHHRGSNQLQATDEDDAANVSAVREMLPRLTTLGTIVDHWRALRASTPDRLP
nr:FAD-dependent oxidoreductase [Gammaproteobacteria bacterium]